MPEVSKATARSPTKGSLEEIQQTAEQRLDPGLQIASLEQTATAEILDTESPSLAIKIAMLTVAVVAGGKGS